MKRYLSSILPLMAAGLLIWTAPSYAQPAAAPDTHTDSSAELQRARQTLVDTGYSPSTLLALGHAQLAQGSLGPAIVSFERGLLLAPRDARLREALSSARQRSGLAPEPPTAVWEAAPAWSAPLAGALQRVSLREWALLAFASSLVTALAWLGVSLLARGRRQLGALLGVSALLLGLTSAAAFADYRQQKSTAYALHAGSALRQSPFAQAHEVGALLAGEAVRVLDAHGEHLLVKSERGATGWIPKRELERVLAGPVGAT